MGLVVLPQLPVARFMALSLHGATIITYYFMKVESIQATLEGPESRTYTGSDLHRDYRRALFRVQLLVFFSWMYFVIEYTSLFSAYSLTWPRACVFNACAHGVGGFLGAWAQLEIWSVSANEYLFLTCTVLPGTLELLVFSIQARRHWLEIHAYADGDLRKKGVTARSLLLLICTLMIAILGLGLTITYVHRSINTGHLLDLPAWTGISLLTLAFLLALYQLNPFLHCFSAQNSAIFQSHTLETVDSLPPSPTREMRHHFRRDDIHSDNESNHNLSPVSSAASPRHSTLKGKNDLKAPVFINSPNSSSYQSPVSPAAAAAATRRRFFQ